MQCSKFSKQQMRWCTSRRGQGYLRTSIRRTFTVKDCISKKWNIILTVRIMLALKHFMDLFAGKMSAFATTRNSLFNHRDPARIGVSLSKMARSVLKRPGLFARNIRMQQNPVFARRPTCDFQIRISKGLQRIIRRPYSPFIICKHGRPRSTN